MTQWSSESERLQYEYAAEETKHIQPPQKRWASRRMEAILNLVGVEFGGTPVKAMPRVKQTRAQRDQSLQELREQIARDRVTGEK